MYVVTKHTCPQVEHIILFPWEAGHPVGHNSEIDCIRSDQQGVAISWKHWPVHEGVIPDEGEHTVRQGEWRAKLLEFHVISDALEKTQGRWQRFPGARRYPWCLVGLLL